MQEQEVIVNSFIEDMGEGNKYSDMPRETLDKYLNQFKTKKDTFDIINYIWKNYGLRSYKNGLFWLINPDEYNDLAKKFPDISENSLVFARTVVGNLFLFEQLKIGEAITYLNIHTGKKNIVSTSFEIFFEFDICTDEFWMEECYGKIELAVIKKIDQPLKEDENLTFVPALFLGGKESVNKMEKVKIKENIEFLSQF